MASGQSLTMDEINTLSLEDFKLVFGNVIEHCPEAAIDVGSKRPFPTINEFKKSFSNYIDNLENNDKKNILKKHPDLISKKQQEKLTYESQNEQKAAGIDVLKNENKRELENLIKQYEKKFLFPFVICARENTITTIISMIQKRLINDDMTELYAAVEEVKKICILRLNDLISQNST